MEPSFPHNPIKIDTELASLIQSYLLMKLGGQISFSLVDLTQLSNDYVGTRIAYDPNLEALTLTLKTRPDAFPPPEPVA